MVKQVKEVIDDMMILLSYLGAYFAVSLFYPRRSLPLACSYRAGILRPSPLVSTMPMASVSLC